MKKILLYVVGLIILISFVLFGTSCGQIKSVVSDSVPKEPGGYIHNGTKWVKVQSEAETYVDGDLKIANFDAAVIPIQEGSFKFAQRFTPSEKQIMGTGLGGFAASETHVWALEVINNNLLSGISRGDSGPIGVTTDKSDFKKGYLLFEFDNLPPSPTGKYYLAVGRQGMVKVICLDAK